MMQVALLSLLFLVSLVQNNERPNRAEMTEYRCFIF